MWVNTFRIIVVTIFGGLVKIFPEIAYSTVDVVVVWIEVKVVGWVASFPFLVAALTLSFVVTFFSVAPPVVVTVSINSALIWVAFWSWRWFFGGIIITWVSYATSNVGPLTSISWMMVLQFSSWTIVRMCMAGCAVSFVCVLLCNT